MKAVVVYESMFGNTRRIAEAIGVGVGVYGTVRVVDVNLVTTEDIRSADLMIVGGPTHAHGMSRPSTRAEAQKWARQPEKNLTLEPEAPGRGIRDWMQDQTEAVAPLFAAFATRADIPVLFGGNAAPQIVRALNSRPTSQVAHAEFFIVDNENRLRGGEVDRARDWGSRVGKAALDAMAVAVLPAL